MKYTLATVDLYEYEYVRKGKWDLNTQSKYVDVERQCKSFKIFGTPEQVDEYLKDKKVDDVYTDKIETKDSYYAGICFQYSKEHELYNAESRLPTLEEYNTKLQERIDRIEKIYIERGSKVLTQ